MYYLSLMRRMLFLTPPKQCPLLFSPAILLVHALSTHWSVSNRVDCHLMTVSMSLNRFGRGYDSRYPFRGPPVRPDHELLPCSKYSCSQACLAEMRPAGSYTSRASSRSSPGASRPGTSGRASSRTHLGKEGLKSGKEVTPGQVISSGVPSNLVEGAIASV